MLYSVLHSPRFLLAFFLLFFNVINNYASISIVEIKPASAEGICDGSMTVIVDGTAKPFKISITSLRYSYKITTTGRLAIPNLCPGQYQVEVTDRFGCKKTFTPTVGVNCRVTLNEPTIIPSCTPGGGSISFTPQNGTPPYRYKWRNVAGTFAKLDVNPVTNLAPDEYLVTVTDANGCSASTTTPISTKPTGEDAIYPYIKKVEVNVTVNGVDILIYEGAWTLSASNCVIYRGDTKPIVQEVYDAIKNGQAGIKVHATASKILDDLNIDLPSTNEAAPAKTNIGTTWNFTYPASVSASMIVSNAIEMPIHFTGEDARGDKLLKLRTLSNDLTQCAPLPTLGKNCEWTPKPAEGTDNVHVVKTSCISANFSIALGSTQYDCADLANVCVAIENGGNGTYSFQWETGQTGACVTNLTPGQSYMVTVTGACGQEKSKSILVPVSTAAPLAIQNATVKGYCGTTQAGSMNVTASFGHPPYGYSWSADNGFTATTNSPQISNLATGQYCVTVTDQCNQSASICRIITNVSSTITVEEVQKIPACSTDGTGSLVNINVSPAGMYEYRWSNGAITEDIQNVAAGAYVLSVTDENGCVTSKPITIQQNPPIILEDVEDAISNPTSCGASDGEIYFRFGGPAGGTPGYDWTWSNGDPGRGHIVGLSSGVYTLTVTDAKGCKGTFDLELIGEDEPQILSETEPSCIDNPVGRISLFLYFEAAPPTPRTYTFNWDVLEDASGVSEYNVTGLPPGNYTVTITDDTHSCGGDLIRTYTIPALTAESPLQVEGVVTKTCPENSSGSIQLQISGGVPFPPDFYYSPYEISWENPSSYDNKIENLEVDSYHVTVTDYCGNSIIKEFDVETDPSLFFDVVATEIKHITSAEPVGRISIAPTVNGNFSYKWNNNATSTNITNLQSGSYTVTVTNNSTGCKIIRNYVVKGCLEVENFDVVITGGSALDANQPIKFELLIKQGDGLFSDEIPTGYSIIWKQPVQETILGYGNTLTLSSTYPHNSVRAIISNGCGSKEVFRSILRCNSPNSSLSSFFIVKKEIPCIGSNDGSVTLSIPSPSVAEVSVKLNNIQLPSYKQGTNTIINIGSLSGKQPYTIEITIGACVFVFGFELEERETTKEFDHVDKVNSICYYKQSCDDVNYGDELFQEQARVEWNKSGLFNSCKASMYCRDRGVGYKDFASRWVYAKEYQYILNNSGNIDYMLSLSNLFEDDNLCRKVLYCQGDLNMITSVPIGPRLTFNSRPNNFTSDEPLEIKPDGNGCLDIKCRSFLVFGSNTHKACPNETDTPYGVTRPEAVDNCLVRSGNVYELFIIYTVLKNQLLTLQGTELGDFLERNGNETWAKCATVTYCSKDLSVVGDNRASVNCESLIPSCDGNGFVGQACTPFPVKDENNNTLGYRVMCIGSGGFCSPKVKIINNCEVPPGKTVDLKKTWNDVKDFFKDAADGAGNVAESVKTAAVDAANFTFEAAKGAVKFLSGIFDSGPACPEWHLLPEMEQEELFPKIILDTFQNEILQNFGTAQYVGIPIPRGILRSSDNTIYHKYDDSEDQIQKDITANLEYAIEDWDYEHFIYVRQILKGKASELVFEDSIVAWINNIAADASFSVKHLSSQGYNIVLGGTFKGDLIYDSTLVAHSDSLSSFLFRIDKDGMLVNAHIIENITSADDVFFSENLNRSIAIAAKHKGEMKVNGTSLGLGTSAGFATLRIDSLDQVQLIRDLKGGANMRLLDITYTADSTNGHFAVAMSGTDTLNANGEFVFKSNTPRLNITTFDQTGVIQWRKAVLANKINLNKFDMAYTYSDSLFVGITFRDTMSFLNQVLQSRGGEDIALVKVTPNGTSHWHRNYGTSEDENISKLMYSYGILYFGGEFTGSTGDKTIGKYVFSNLIEANTKSYISYIYDEIPPTDETAELRSSDYMALQSNSNTEVISADIEVYPNPFTGNFTVRTNGQEVSKIGITNSMGQSVYNFDSGDLNQIDIDFTGKENGLYFVKVYGISGVLIGTEKIVKID